LNNEKLLAKILEKWPVKVLSLAAALIIALFYRMNTLDTRSFSVPIQIEANTLFVPTGSFVDTVRISLRGETNGINPILEEDIVAFINLEKYTKEGSYRVPVQIRKKGSALGVEPLEITVLPMEIPLTLEQIVVRTIPVFPAFRGAIAQGYELINQYIIPDSVTAEGPRSALEGRYNFLTETINLEGRHENFSVLINIINDNPLITIHESQMIEYNGIISPFMRETQRFNFIQGYENEDYPDTGETEL